MSADLSIDGGQLSAFSAILEQCVRSIDTTMTQVKMTVAQATSAIQTLEETVAKQTESIMMLESENQHLRLRIDGVIDNNSLLEKDMKQQIVDSTASMHKELLVHRTGTKMDLNNMKNSLMKTLQEKVTQIEEQQAEQNNRPTSVVVAGGTKGSGGGVDAEVLSSIAQRLYSLESASLNATNLQNMIEVNINSDDGSLAKFNSSISTLQKQVAGLMEDNNFLRAALASQIDTSKISITTPKTDSSISDFDENLNMRIKFVGQRAKRFSKFYYETYRPDQQSKDGYISNSNDSDRDDKESDRSGPSSSRYDPLTRNDAALPEVDAISSQELREAEVIENSIDAYTIEESDDMFNRLERIEKFVSENNTIQFQVRKLIDGISDMKVEFDTIHTKLAAVRQSADDSSNPDKMLIRAILKNREDWGAFYHDLVYALEIIADEDADKEEEKTRHTASRSILEDDDDDEDGIGVDDEEDDGRDRFVVKLKQLEELLKATLDKFEILNNSGADTAFELFPHLDSLTLLAEDVIQYENHIRESKQMSNLDTRTFEDVYCMDRTKSLKSRLITACKNTYPIMDKNVTVITMRRRIEVAEEKLSKKAEAANLNLIETDIRKLLSTKAEQEELISVSSKKASVVEVQKIKDILTRQIDQFKRGMGLGIGDGGDVNPEEALGKNNNLKAEIAEISNRFDLLFKHFQDLQAYCSGFHATREEVNEAFVHVLSEMKGLKTSSVPLDLFKDVMKTKADAVELTRLISSLSETMGNLNGRGDASVVHVPIKCLACNKPATHIAPPDDRKQILFSRSVDNIFPISDDMNDEMSVSNGNFPHSHSSSTVRPSSVARPTSKFIPSKKKDPMELPPIEREGSITGARAKSGK